MTIGYTLDVSYSSTKSFFKILCKWRGSIWKAILHQLFVWCLAYFAIALIYRFALPYEFQREFDKLAKYLSKDIYQIIPLTFMLGFFVTFVVGRWSSILSGIGWIDNSAMAFAAFINGSDDETKLLRRTLVRHMVLTQTLVLRDISLQVRKRFPALETLIAAGLLTKKELEILENIDDHYSRYWVPMQWCYQHLCKARVDAKIPSDHLMGKITQEVHTFQHGLATLLKFDWVPVPLIYPQLIFLSVRVYFVLCLFSRQFLRDSDFDIWIPVTTMIQFMVYMGWMKVAEMLLNPLGEDDDDLECNHVIDKNLITGLTLVNRGGVDPPEMEKDAFWDETQIAPLYTKVSSKRQVHPLIGSAAELDLVKNKIFVEMIPHCSVFERLDDIQKKECIQVVEIKPTSKSTVVPENQGLMFDSKHHEEQKLINHSP